MVSDKISEKSKDVQDETDNFVLTEILNPEEEIAEKKNRKLAKWIFVASTFLITATALGITVDLNHCVSLKNLTDYKSLRTEFLKDNTKCLYNRTFLFPENCTLIVCSYQDKTRINIKHLVFTNNLQRISLSQRQWQYLEHILPFITEAISSVDEKHGT